MHSNAPDLRKASPVAPQPAAGLLEPAVAIVACTTGHGIRAVGFVRETRKTITSRFSTMAIAMCDRMTAPVPDCARNFH